MSEITYDALRKRLAAAEAQNAELRAERNTLERENEIMVKMIEDMATIFINARAMLKGKK